ncbi:conserved exported hypothetical protein [Burkholderiales bacterium 8X]|nr:conserved exported hypothetical protein [Burkholderiales bacterium 8X]
MTFMISNKLSLRRPLGALLAAGAAMLAMGIAQAQTAPVSGASGAADAAQAEANAPSRNQKIEHIRVEDGGARVDEVRYGGRTQSITVQPKANVPSYEVLPNDGGRSRQGQQETGTGGNGARVWNLFKF